MLIESKSLMIMYFYLLISVYNLKKIIQLQIIPIDLILTS
jgi:hypothetical protein